MSLPKFPIGCTVKVTNLESSAFGREGKVTFYKDFKYKILVEDRWIGQIEIPGLQDQDLILVSAPDNAAHAKIDDNMREDCPHCATRLTFHAMADYCPKCNIIFP